MMRVALYLRRSTEELQLESLETQRLGAERFCAKQHWSIVATYEDSGISRAEFVRRPALHRMLAGARAKDFDVIVCRDSSRLGGDMLRVTQLLQDLRDANVAVWYYATAERVQIDTSIDRLLLSVRGFADEQEREKISSRTAERLSEKARKGLAAGGGTYGYRTIDDKLAVVEHEAATVRRIFELYATGSGVRSICTTLNADQVAAPNRRGKRSSHLWLRNAVFVMLRNARYIGAGEYGRRKNVYRQGTKKRDQRIDADVISYPTPAIIDRALWDRVQSLIAGNESFGRGRTTKGAPPKYLLTGLARCGYCSGPIYGGRKRRGAGRVAMYYCGRRHDVGVLACAQKMLVPTEIVERAVCAQLQRMLSPDLVDALLDEIRKQLETPQGTEHEEIATQVEQLRRELARLTAALAATDSADTIVGAIKDRSARLKLLETKLRQARPRESLNWPVIEAAARKELANLHVALSSTDLARKALQDWIGARPPLLYADRVEGWLGVTGLCPTTHEVGHSMDVPWTARLAA